jgi:hypothetical protein
MHGPFSQNSHWWPHINEGSCFVSFSNVKCISFWHFFHFNSFVYFRHLTLMTERERNNEIYLCRAMATLHPREIFSPKSSHPFFSSVERLTCLSMK